MKFNKTYFKMSASIFISLLITGVFSFMSIPLALILKGFFTVFFSGIMPTIILFVFIYQTSYQQGWRDPNRVKLGQETFTPLKGFIVGLAAFLPSLLLLILNIIIKNKTMIFIFRLMNFYTLGFINLFPRTYSAVCFAIFIIGILLSGAAYLLGYNRISPYALLVYKKDDNQQK